MIKALADRLPFVNVEHGLSEVETSLLFELRMPRVVIGGLVGAVLAVAGAGYQGVFRNPLADPYLLGVAAGAGLGATAVIGAWCRLRCDPVGRLRRRHRRGGGDICTQSDGRWPDNHDSDPGGCRRRRVRHRGSNLPAPAQLRDLARGVLRGSWGDW